MIAVENSTIHMQLLPLQSINEPQLAVEAALTFFSVQKTNLRLLCAKNKFATMRKTNSSVMMSSPKK